MITTDQQFQTYAEAKDVFAPSIADDSKKIDPSISAIYRIISTTEGDTSDPLKLLEINPETIPAGIVPIYIGNRMFNWVRSSIPLVITPIPIVAIDVTPYEFDQIKAGKLKLPDGWVLDRLLA